MRKVLAFVLAFTLVAVPVTSGCATFKPNPTQTQVEQTRELAGKVLGAVKSGVLALRSLQDLEISLHQAGTVTDNDHKRIQTAFLQVFTALDLAVVRIGEATTRPELRTTLELITRDLATLSQSLAVSNPSASKALQTAAAVVTAAMDIALGLIGGV